ncbi:werner syndrome-like exonuclease-like protein [Trifolium pratense]|uniref:Werner syndrome-like exonuclease-like protein n=2 Tax=Trifolium pratense TaxID=57577 RepID=A0A2K3KXR3_TRIPR|nr:werner syndrome-like exonuclease-like protein [Trifolium pratense]CAJ2629022.1 unnamed protein product [Trifolium pratense]
MSSGYGDLDHVETFNLNFTSIKTTVTCKRDVVDDHISAFLRSQSGFYNKTKVFGFDTEWLVHNPGASAISSKCAALHLFYGNACLIILLSRFEIVPQSLVNFLRHPNFTFVGFGINDNVAKLEKNYGFGCKNAVELGPLAATVMKRPRLSYFGVDELLLAVNGIDLANQRPLSFAFVWDKYEDRKELAKIATISVYSYHMIGTKLLAQDWRL